jgi:hypothetical protein
MELLEKVNKTGYPGMLVFAKEIRDISYDDVTGEEILTFEDKLRAGFILYESEYFDHYYHVKFFDGEKAFVWGVDLFYRKEEEIS